MKLYKNVGIEDLNSIMKMGILPISITKNNNWEEGKRANNSIDVVYLFSQNEEQKKVQNSFVHYGFVLLEVEVENAIKNEMLKSDGNIKKYTEYIISEVKPSEIKKIYIPEILKNRVKRFINDSFSHKVVYVKMEADEYENGAFVPASNDVLEQFAKTFELTCSFRGLKLSGAVLDLYNIKYLI